MVTPVMMEVRQQTIHQPVLVYTHWVKKMCLLKKARNLLPTHYEGEKPGVH